jgi:hypothetical protein
LKHAPNIRLWLLLCAALALAACRAYDATLLDAPRPSASRSACAERSELCNGLDDDCDGIIDEEASASCDLPHARSHCKGGKCALDGCDDGHLSCDDTSDNGCEHDLAACGGGCDHACSSQRLGGAGHAALDPGSSELGRAEVDAGEPDHDAGACSREACNGADDDCDGKVDEDVACCLAAAPTGQGGDCDRCACERCSGALDRCLHGPSPDWSTSCGSLLRCFGTATVDGRCGADDPDCAVACGAQWLAAGWRPNRDCNPDELGVACGAFVLIRQTCYQTRCDKVCKR